MGFHKGKIGFTSNFRCGHCERRSSLSPAAGRNNGFSAPYAKTSPSDPCRCWKTWSLHLVGSAGGTSTGCIGAEEVHYRWRFRWSNKSGVQHRWFLWRFSDSYVGFSVEWCLTQVVGRMGSGLVAGYVHDISLRFDNLSWVALAVQWG